MFKADLHTHSDYSHDGGISLEQYQHILNANILDCIAITDHNRVDHALAIQQILGTQVIVGEEILTTVGEIIGLYLTERIPPGLTAQETIQQIKAQHGIVYIPHPFETVRKGLHPATLEEIQSQIDIIEVCNGRAFLQNKSAQTVVWARLNHLCGAASSDAHGLHGLGRTYTALSEQPTHDTLLTLLQNGIPITARPTIRSLLYPKYHRMRKKRAGKQPR